MDFRQLPVDPFDRFLALIEVIVVALAGTLIGLAIMALFGYSGLELMESGTRLSAFMILEATLTLLLVGALLALRGQTSRLIGAATPKLSNLLFGFACVPLLFVVTLVVGTFFRAFAPDWVTDQNPLLALIQSPLDVALFVLASCFTGGLKEEVQRAFVLERFRSHLGGVWFGLALWTAFFAYGHLAQGADNAIGAGALGLAFGLLYILRGSLWGPVGAHALFNTTTVLLYWLALSG